MRKNTNSRLRYLLCVILSVFLLSSIILHVFAAESITISNLNFTWEESQTIVPVDSNQSNQSTNGGTSDVTYDSSTLKFTLTATNSNYHKGGFLNLSKYYAQNYTASLKLTNTSNYTVIINYTVSGTIDNVSEGTYTKTILNGDYLSFSTSSKATSSTVSSNTTTTGYITINSIEAITNVNVSFSSSPYGGYTYTIGEDTVQVAPNATSLAPVSLSVNDKVTLTASDAVSNGYAFYCWMASGRILGYTDGEYSLAKDSTVYPVYLPNTVINAGAPFTVGNNNHMFWHLAMEDGVLTGNTVILNQNLTLPATLAENGLASNNEYVSASNGRVAYAIPSGVKLLIPYGTSDSGDFDTNPVIAAEAARSPFRTLTIPDNTTITCYGEINVNGRARQSASSWTGGSTGAYGKINLNGTNAKLILASANTTNSTAGKLYCYGFITGTGSVEAQSGAAVYELFDATGFRGGSTAAQWVNSSGLTSTYKSFFFSEYSIHNIESTLKVYSGATSNAVFSCEPSVGDPIQSTLQLIGSSNSLFTLSSGASIVRTYDYNRDVAHYTVYGTAALSNFKLKLATMLGSSELDTASYILGINGGMEVTIAGNVSINYNIKLLPGSKLTIADTGKLIVNSNLYLYDAADYVGNYFCYYTQLSKNNSVALPYVHEYDCMPTIYIATTGVTYNYENYNAAAYFPRTVEATDHAQLIVNGTLEVGTSGGIYTTTNGATSPGKVLKGSGTFINNNTTATKDVSDVLDEMYWEYYSGTDLSIEDKNINVSPVIGLLSGISTSTADVNDSFGQATYYGLGADLNNYWYQHTVTLAEGTTQTITPTTDSVWDGSTGYIVTGGAFKFTIPNATGEECVTVTNATVSCTDGTYTVTGDGNGDVVITIAEHAYDEGKVTTDPTCTEKGVKTFTCGTCEHTKTEEVDTISHTASETYSSDGTYHWHNCTACGEDLDKTACSGGTANCHTQATCSTCGNPYGEFDSSVHDGETEVRLYAAATCGKDGYTGDTYCLGCNTKIADGTSIPASGEHTAGVAATCTTAQTCTVCGAELKAALGHTETDLAAVAATCTQSGLTAGKKCTVCNTVTVAQETVPALGHTEVVDAAVAATCTGTGLTEGSHCSVCKAVIVAQNEVAALGHTAVVDAAVAPTCGSDGLTEGSHCSVCNEVLVAQESVANLGHSAVVDAAVDATCTTTGLTEGSHCITCSEVIQAQEVVPALGHVEVVDTGHAKTCTTDGLTEGKHCGRCGEVLVAQEIIPAGHDWNSATGECTACDAVCTHTFDSDEDITCDTCGFGCEHNMNVVVTAPDCENGGYTTHTCTKNCGYTYKTDIVSALGHDWVVANCTTAKTCDRCGITEGDPLGHTEGAPVTENNVDATCTTEGSYDTVVYCSVCDAELSRKTTSVPKIAHTYTETVTAPTCTEKGFTTHACACGESYVDSYEDATGHTWSDWETVQAATCVDAGSKSRSCQNNGCTSTETRVITATGHSYGAWYTEAETSCEAPGTEKRECANCDGYETQKIAALGHSYDNGVVTTEPTCAVDGVKTFTCQRDATHTYTEPIAALGHTDGEVVVENNVAPDCENAGSYDNVVYCTVCDEELSRVTTTVEATGHDYDAVVTDPTCTEDGYTTYTCATCGNSYVADEVAAQGHSYSSSVTTEPTCTEAGVKTFTCGTCGDSYTEAVAAAGHSYASVVTAPTCAAKGYTTYTCSGCGNTYTDDETEATGHVNTTITTVDATCVADGSVTVTCDDCGTTISTETIAATGHNYVDGVCGTCGENEPVKVTYKFGQSVQIGLIEPWFLKANCLVYVDSVNNPIDYSCLDDYGAYFVRASELSDPNTTQSTITVQDFLDNPNVVHCAYSEGTATIDGSLLTATYNRGLYTYEMSDSIFVMFYIVENGETQYVPARERNLQSLLEARKDDTLNFKNALERNVYSAMHQLEANITTYRASFDKIDTLAAQKAPTLAEFVVENGAFTAEVTKTYTIGNSVQIVLIEPWGLKVNAMVSTDGLKTAIDYSKLEEYGAIVFYDTDNVYKESGMTAEQLRTCENAYVFSSNNGDAFVDGSLISAIYNKGIYTYMLNSNAYVMFYVKDSDGYHYGDVKVRNVYELAMARKDDTVNFKNELERNVYAAMVNVYDAVTAYREDYFKNHDE